MTTDSTTTEPPPGHQVSRPGPGDAVAIHALVSRYDTAVIGGPDATLGDIADELADPAFDPSRDGWLVHDREGGLAGWAWACRKGAGDNVDIEVVAPDPRVAGWLWDAVTARAREIAAGLGHPGVRIDVPVYRGDTAKREIAAARGFAFATGFHRMRADHRPPVEVPAPPSGVTIEHGGAAEVREPAHAVEAEGFADHFGYTPRGYDEWHAELAASGSTDWTQLLLARVGGEPAAMLLGSEHFADDNLGYVRRLAVLPAFRGRGLGRLLLLRAFAGDAARGREGTVLHVDSANTTPALDLYHSVGMRQILAIDVWRRTE